MCSNLIGVMPAQAGIQFPLIFVIDHSGSYWIARSCLREAEAPAASKRHQRTASLRRRQASGR
jgi:hypothetical protein